MLSNAPPAGAGAALTEVAPAIVDASGRSRRDIAFVPLLVIALGALGLLASQLLRPAEQFDGATGPVIVALSALTAVLCLLAAAAHRLVRGAGSRTLLRAYTTAATALVVGLLVIAAIDQGLATVAVGAAMVIAASAGLALPGRASRITVVAIVAGLLAVHALTPLATWLEAATVIGLAVAGWVIGLVLRRGHRGASRDALLLSRGDQLTGLLNRRGFVENAAYVLDRAARRREPVLLVKIGLLDGLGAALGGAARRDDAALVDVVATLTRELPAGSTFGRLGADRLGVLIAGGRSIDAEWFAGAAREALAGRVALFFGAASSPDGSAALGELFDVAEACLLEARRRSPQGCQLSEVFGLPGPPVQQRGPVARPPVSYARLRAVGGPPATVEPWGIDGQWILGGLATVALAGGAFLAGSVAEGHDGLGATIVAYAGLPWVLTVLAVGYVYRRHPRSAGHPPLLPVVLGSGLVVGGVAVAALATGEGLHSPVIAALYLKALFDASTFERRLARALGACVGVAWLLVLLLGPSSAWWAAPFQLTLLAGAFALGRLGHNAYEAATAGRLDLARTDPFTGLLDRRGFYEQAEALVALGDPAGRAALGVVLIDVEPLSPRAVNGAPASGPRRTPAGIVAQHLREASVVARFDDGDYRAVVRVESRAELESLVLRLREQLAAVSPACLVGAALYGPDGVTLDALLAIASHRAGHGARLADAA